MGCAKRKLTILQSFATLLVVSTIPVAATPILVNQTQTYSQTPDAKCRCFPGDNCWPSLAEWTTFNHTINGKLIATIPIGSACHHDSFLPYNNQSCADLQNVWFNEETHSESASSIMAPFFANQSCDPFLPVSARCVVGTYIEYAVNASSAVDYQETIAFVKRHNIRLVIRNTGHDYIGKSTGAGAVGIWTHNIKDIEFTDHDSDGYVGKAVKLGAGVQAHEAYTVAQKNGLLVVGGNCPTVGIVGGYTQGGGHGPLASKFGLAADQVLEWEVVTADGLLLKASPSENPDLYWALCGGGGGTYAVVLSMTIKVYPDMRSSAANLTFTDLDVSADDFWEAVGYFHQHTLPSVVKAGGVAVWGFSNFSTASFALTPMYGPNISLAEMNTLMRPVLDKLTLLKINYTYFCEEYNDFLSSYEAMNPSIPTGKIQIGGRWIPKSVVEQNNTSLTTAFRSIVSLGGGFSGLALDVSRPPPHKNAVNPKWRDTLFDAVIFTPYSYTDWDSNLEAQDRMTNQLLPLLEELTPAGGAYLNEADFHQKNWQETFYGENYKSLIEIKKKYDPEDMFYALTGVGSEVWTEQLDGRLCRS